MDNIENRDRLVIAPSHEVLAIDLAYIRQTINATFVDYSAPLMTREEALNCDPAYIVIVENRKKIKAIVAIPDFYHMSLIPYPMRLDWQVAVRKYDSTVYFDDKTSYPLLDNKYVLGDFHENYEF